MGKYQKNIEAARQISVVQYLETYRPGELVRKTDREYCTRSHDSLIITIGNGKFHWYQQQTHLLWEHRLQTLAEVQAHKSNLENQIEQLARQRKVLYRQKQEPERAAREEQIQKLTKQIKALCHEFYICTDIEADAAMMQEKLRQAELAAQQERNEVKEDEYKRRSSRPDGARGASVFRGGY